MEFRGPFSPHRFLGAWLEPRQGGFYPVHYQSPSPSHFFTSERTHSGIALSSQESMWSPEAGVALSVLLTGSGLKLGNHWIMQKGLTRHESDLALRPGQQLSPKGPACRGRRRSGRGRPSGLGACLSLRLSFFLLLYTLKSSGFCQATGL